MGAHILRERKITLDTGAGDSAHAAASHGVEFEAENGKMHFTTRFLDSFQLISRPGK
jgi:hypothetical protein